MRVRIRIRIELGLWLGLGIGRGVERHPGVANASHKSTGNKNKEVRGDKILLIFNLQASLILKLSSPQVGSMRIK